MAASEGGHDVCWVEGRLHIILRRDTPLLPPNSMAGLDPAIQNSGIRGFRVTEPCPCGDDVLLAISQTVSACAVMPTEVGTCDRRRNVRCA